MPTPVLAVEPAGEAPATGPAVPALIDGTPPPESFVVHGIIRFSPSVGRAFHVASDGVRQVCGVHDPDDGTPLFLSHGQQTLVYDWANTRVVRVPASRRNVSYGPSIDGDFLGIVAPGALDSDLVLISRLASG
jgi:hypothetical protein